MIGGITKLILLITVISVFVPFSPKMPAPGLDPSWALGLNQAIAQGLSFGKDIVFTLGPYAAIYSKAYHPATDFMMMSGSLYLALCYWLSVILLMGKIKWHWILLFAVLLFTMIYARDSLFFSYPLLVGLICYQLVSQQGCFAALAMTGIPNNYSPFYLTLLFTPFGLLPLIKGSLLILCTLFSILCSTLFIIHKRAICAMICLLSPIASLLLFWLAAGQSLSNLTSYLSSTITLACGFTEAMAIGGRNSEMILYLISAALLLLVIARQKQIPTCQRMFALCFFYAFLFISFKAGFTRHFGHVFIASSSILIAAFLLPLTLPFPAKREKIKTTSFSPWGEGARRADEDLSRSKNQKSLSLAILFALYTWYSINSHYTLISIPNNFKSNFAAAWFGLKNRINDKNYLKQDFALTMNFLHQRASFPLLPGTSDIYSTEQSYLISSPNTWAPRPIFQSYSVFTTNLAKQNREYLASNGPDNIFFKIEPIDARVPALEDGLSWPLLIANYRPQRMINDFLLLQKTAPHLKPLQRLVSKKYRLGDVVNLPVGDQPLFAEIDITPTIWGHLAIIFFKPVELQIIFTLKNGIKKQYRIIATMAKSSFLISPLIETTQEFALLYGNPNDLNEKTVKSLEISAKQNNSWQWQQEYFIHFKNYPTSSLLIVQNPGTSPSIRPAMR